MLFPISNQSYTIPKVANFCVFLNPKVFNAVNFTSSNAALV